MELDLRHFFNFEIQKVRSVKYNLTSLILNSVQFIKLIYFKFNLIFNPLNLPCTSDNISFYFYFLLHFFRWIRCQEDARYTFSIFHVNIDINFILNSNSIQFILFITFYYHLFHFMDHQWHMTFPFYFSLSRLFLFLHIRIRQNKGPNWRQIKVKWTKRGVKR